MYIVGSGHWIGNPGIRSGAMMYSMANGRGPVLWCKIDQPELYSINAGSESALRYIDAVQNLSQITTPINWAGSTLAQGGATTVKPVAATYPEGRVMFFDGVNDQFQSSLAASAFTGWHGAPGTEIDITFRIKVTDPGRILGTFNPGAATGLGFALTMSGSDLIFRLGDGVGPAFFVNETAVGALPTGVTSTIRILITGSTYDLWVNGTNVITGSHSGNNAGTPNNALVLGDAGGANLGGYISEFIAFDQALNDTEVQSLSGYMFRWPMSVNWDQLRDYAALWQLKMIGASSGTAWVDRLAAYAATEIGSPTHGTSASFGGKNVITLDGATQYVTFDALAALFSGDDVPMYLLTAVELDNVATNHTMGSIGHTGGGANGYARYRSNSIPDYEWVRSDGIDTDSPNAGTADTSAHRVAGSYHGTQASQFLDGARIDELGACDVDPISVNAATMGAWRTASVSERLAGDIAAQIWGAQPLNHGDHNIVDAAVAAQFGL